MKFLGLIFLWTINANAVDLQKLEEELKSTGAVGYVHGTTGDRALQVFTYRNPANFFDNVQLPMISSIPEVEKELQMAKRNQKVRLFGSFVNSRAPIKHIDVSKMELVADFNSELDQYPHSYKAQDTEYSTQSEIVARVHAIDQGGKVLVIEYKDLVTPVFVRSPLDQAVVKTLYRGDKIKLNYIVRTNPQAPLHLLPQSSDTSKPAIEVLEKILDLHGKNITLSGHLVKFVQSPQIKFDVYAVLKEDAEGSNIQFTLINFTDPNLFKELREKLEKMWLSNTSNIENGRNKLINRNIKISVSGTGNVQDQGQANPQILINLLSDIKLE